MPLALLFAFAASIGLHALVLFGADINLSAKPENPPILAELRPAPMAQPAPPPVSEKKLSNPRKAPAKAPRRAESEVSSGPRVMSVPESSPDTVAPIESSAASVPGEPKPPPEPPSVVSSPPELEKPTAIAERNLPPRGQIRFRVDRGDSNFEIGSARQEWEIVEGRYRLVSVMETTGLIRLFKSVRSEMESLGEMVPEGFRPDVFITTLNGRDGKGKAFFDWNNMRIRVGGRGEQALVDGAQDLLSFGYQLGFVPHIEAGATLWLATGKRFALYRLEVAGDEEIETPAGTMRTLHLRATAGEQLNEVWLAYDYVLLPVKIRHVDKEGDSYVLVATELKLGE